MPLFYMKTVTYVSSHLLPMLLLCTHWPSAAVEIAGAYAGAYAMRPYIETGGMRRDHPFCQLNCRLSYGSIAEAASFCYNEREVKPMAELDKRKFGAFVAALRKENGMTQKPASAFLIRPCSCPFPRRWA